jgi:hypothetical protein
MTKYTKEEKEFMKNYVPGHSHKEIKEEFLKRFGYIPCKSFPSSYIKNNGLHTGRTGRFKKGHVPVNKGKKMPKTVYEKAKATMFKAGSIPTNTMPIGTEKMLPDGYVWIKINDLPRVKKQENWKQKQRVVYEKHYGKIPEGHVVIFLDRNRENFDPENLAAIKRSELARLNKQGLIYDDTNLTKVGIGIVRLSSKILERSEE